MKNPSLKKSYNKIIKIIKSCKTKEHSEGASKIIKNFKEIYGKVDYPKVLSYSLERALKIKKL